jgi:hypothetical protein
MKTSLIRVFGVLLLTAVLGVTLAYGQSPILTAKVNFAFEVLGKTLPPGEYTFTFNPSDQTFLSIRGVAPDTQNALVPVATRMALEGTSDQARLVFDKIGNRALLSEVWFPNEDGFLLLATPQKHTHVVVKANASKKK